MADVEHDERRLSPEHPEFGEIHWHNQLISLVAHWVENGHHVFRSTEFDLIAGDPDVDAAIQSFVGQAEDLATMYSELDADDVTPDEAVMAIRLMQRFSAAYRSSIREHEQREAKKPIISVNLRRSQPARRRESDFTPSPLTNLSPLQPA